MKKKTNKDQQENYLERKPKRHEAIAWAKDEKGIVTLDIENTGFLKRLAQKFFHKPKVTHMHLDETVEGPKSQLKKTTMMVLAVTLHNIPEGMAVGVLYAGWASGSADITEAGALALALGIAIQNFPEGAIISMPLRSKGLSRTKACWYGVLSGIVEPLAGLLTILLSTLIIPVLPYLLSFAAGAMIYVVIEELIPEMSEGEHSNWGTILFMIGFSLMMVLDVALG